MASQSVSGFAAALKTLYPQKKIEELTYGSNVWFALVPKDENFVGENLNIAVTHADITGANSSFSQASTDKAGSTKVKFVLTRKPEYALASIDGELIEASARNAGALVSAVKAEMDSAFRITGMRIGRNLYRDGSGQIGTISTGTTLASTTLELTNADDIVNYYVGQKIVFAANNTSALRSATARTVNAIDEDLGTCTLDANVNDASTTIAVSDAIFTKGDYVSASDRNCIMGLSGWIPTSVAATGDSHFSVDRAANVAGLAGHRLTGTSLQIDEAIMKGAVRVARSGGKPDTCFVSHSQYEQLVNVLGSKVTYEDHDVGSVGFTSIRVIGPAGVINVFADFNCEPDVAYVVQRDTWKLFSLNKAPHILGLSGGDGMRLLRESSADAYELRVGTYGNLACMAPKWNARVSLTVPS